MRVFWDSQRIRIKGDKCLYCGQPAETDDHFPPLAFTGPCGRGFLLPACTECNGIVGARYPTNLWKRCDAVKAGIRRKYRKILKAPLWDDEDLEEMSETFRKGLAACTRTKELIGERLVWSAESYLSRIVEPRDFADYVARINITPESEPDWCKSLREIFPQT